MIFTPLFRSALAASKMLRNSILRGLSTHHNIVRWGQSLRIFPNLAILRDFLASFSRLCFFRVIFGTFWPFLVTNSNCEPSLLKKIVVQASYTNFFDNQWPTT